MCLAIVGVLGFVDSYLILASSIVFGWFIIGAIGFVTLICGIALIRGVNWSWNVGTTMAILNIFVGFVESIGAFNSYYAILGWVGLGQGVGGATVILSAATLYLLFRQDVQNYFFAWI